MRLIAFGSYDFTADGIGVVEAHIANRRVSGLITIPDADGAYDGYGSGQSPKQPLQIIARLEMRATASLNIDQQVNAFLQEAHKGQQWLKFKLADGSTIYRALAKCLDDSRQHSRGTQIVLPFTTTFELAEPYWYGDSQITTPFTVSATPTACDLNNLGTAPLIKAILRFTGTCNRPKWTNNTNGYSIELNRNITVSKVVEIDLGAQTVTYDGADDWANVVIPATQIGLFKFDVGANDIDFTAAGGGTPSGTVQFIYRWMYH